MLEAAAIPSYNVLNKNRDIPNKDLQKSPWIELKGAGGFFGHADLPLKSLPAPYP